MKKWLLVLGMITCIFGVSACGTEKAAESTNLDITDVQAAEYGKQLVQGIAEICGSEQYSADVESMKTDPMLAAAIDSWVSAQTDMGNYVGILESTAVISDDGVVINVKVDGESHDANVEILMDDELMTTSISTNVIYSFGELMEKAALNTLLGMGTVFVVLILISIIISCFNFIPKLQAAFSKKAKEEEKPAAVDHTIAQIVEKEELSDDLELVAVIAAAVAASEGAVSTDGFVVRSIRRRKI